MELSGSAEYTGDGIRSRGPVIAEFPGQSVGFDGFLPFTAGLVGADLRLDVQGASLAGLFGLFMDAEGLPTLPYGFSTRLRIEERAYRFDDLDGTLGSNSVAGSGVYVSTDDIAGTRVDFRAGGPAFEEFVAAFADASVNPGPFELAASVRFKSDAVEFAGQGR